MVGVGQAVLVVCDPGGEDGLVLLADDAVAYIAPAIVGLPSAVNFFRS